MLSECQRLLTLSFLNRASIPAVQIASSADAKRTSPGDALCMCDSCRASRVILYCLGALRRQRAAICLGKFA